MANTRKTQDEINKLLKKITEGMEVYEEIFDKFANAANQALKERFESDLKKEIKKLQRLREQIRSLLTNPEVKDKKALEAARRRIEEKMEAFKVCERETKTKAFSKEGLASRSDSAETPVERTEGWLKTAIADLKEQAETVEFEIQNESGGSSKKKKKDDPRDTKLLRLKYNMLKLEQLLRLVINEELLPEEVDEIEDDVQRYLDENGEEDFEEDEELFDRFDLPDVVVKAGADASDEDEPSGPAAAPAAQPATSASAKKTPATPAATVAAAKAAPPPPAPKKEEAGAGGRVVVPAKAAPDTPPTNPAAAVKPAATSAIVPGLTAAAVVAGAAAAAAPTAAAIVKAAAAAAPAPAAKKEPAAAAAVPSTPTAAVAAKKVAPAAPSTTSGPASPLSASGPKAATPSPSSAASQSSQAVAGGTFPAKLPALQPPPASLLAGSSGGLGDELLEDGDEMNDDTFGDDALSGGGGATLADMSQMTHQLTATSDWDRGRPNLAKPQQPPNMTSSGSDAAKGNMAMPVPRSQQQQQHQQQQQPSAAAAAPPAAAAAAATSTSSPWAGNVAASAAAIASGSRGSLERQSFERMLDMSVMSLPHVHDVERIKAFIPPNPYRTPSYYPSQVHAGFSSPEMFSKLEHDTLFFIFYYQQATYQQYLAAKELKKKSFRYHKKYRTWFQRHEKPKVTADDYESGTYLYFDYENGWCQRIKNDFQFKYQYLEDELA